MKKVAILNFLLSLTLVISAQRAYVPSTADLDNLLKTKTYVVLEDSPFSDFNVEMKKIMPEVWKLTDYDFISISEFEQKSKDPASSFLYVSNVTFDRDVTGSKYIFLHFSMGGDNLSLNDLRDLISIPLGYTGIDPEYYDYKLILFVKFIQNHIHRMRERPELISSNVFRSYNNNMADVQGKTLYLIAEDLARDVNTAAKIKAVYPYKVSLVDRDEISKAVAEGNKDVVFLHKVGPKGKLLKARCYKVLIGAGDANFYYYFHHVISSSRPDGFLGADFKKLAKAKKR